LPDDLGIGAIFADRGRILRAIDDRRGRRWRRRLGRREALGKSARAAKRKDGAPDAGDQKSD